MREENRERGEMGIERRERDLDLGVIIERREGAMGEL